MALDTVISHHAAVSTSDHAAAEVYTVLILCINVHFSPVMTRLVNNIDLFASKTFYFNSNKPITQN